MTHRWSGNARRIWATVVSLVNTGRRFLPVLLEQGFIGLGNFAVSWTALRSFGLTEVASFALLWAVAWGSFSVISESVLTPIRVADLKLGNQNALRSIAWAGIVIAITGSIFALALGQVGWGTAGEIAACASVPFAAMAFFASRAIGQARDNVTRTSVGCGIYALASFSFATLAIVAVEEPFALLISAVCALLIGAAAVGVGAPTARLIIAGLSIVPRQFWRGRIFAVSTLLRVILFSVGMLATIRLTQGDFAAAVYAAAFVLISPSQVLSSSLPWSMLPRLARSAGTPARFRKELSVQVLIYLFVSVALAGALAIVWEAWVAVSIREPSLLTEVRGQYWLVAVLMGAIVMSSVSTSALQATQAQMGHFVSVMIGGVVGLMMAALGGNVIVAAAIPYVIAIVIGTSWSIQREIANGK